MLRAFRDWGLGAGALGLLLLGASRSAQAECADYGAGLHWVGTLDTGGASEIVLAGHTAYVTDPSGMAILDVSSFANPRITGRVELSGSPTGIAVAGNRAYVSCTKLYSGVLHVIDVSNPATPAIVASIDTPWETFGVALSGGHVYVAEAYGLGVYDISNPAAPSPVGGADTQGTVYRVAATGTSLVVANGTSGILILDISNPNHPVPSGSLDTPGDARGVAVSGSHAYVADGAGGLLVVDIANPSAPTIVGSAAISTGSSLAIVGERVYVASGYGFEVVDVATPASPQILGGGRTPGTVCGIVVAGAYACVASTAGVEFFDISDPAPPRIDIRAGLTFCDANAVAAGGDYVYVVDSGADDEGCSGALEVVDVSDPTRPRAVARLDTPRGACNVAVSGSHAYVAAGSNGLEVIDVSNPESPTRVGRLEGLETCSVAAAGEFAYVTAWDGGLQVVDVSDPSAPAIVGRFDALDRTWGVVAQGDRAYVMDDTRGLVVIDVSHPDSPTIAGMIAVYGNHAVSGAYAYVSSLESGLVVVDVSNPGTPAVVGRVACPAGEVEAAGGYAYVASDAAGMPVIVVIDVSQPTAPRIVGRVVLQEDDLADLVATGSRVYVVGGYEEGLRILPAQCEPTPVLVSDLAAHARGDGILLRWRASRDDFATFDVWRASGPDPAWSLYARLGAAREAGADGGWEYMDAAAFGGETYAYRIEGRTDDGATIDFGPIVARALPGRDYALGPVHPFPARETATIAFSLPQPGPIRLEVYDARGRKVRGLVDDIRTPGNHLATWDGHDDRGLPVGSGLYFVRLSWTGGALVQRAAFVR